ncbi:hypothetical protein J6Z19_02055 [bacterium]|nr:hypothetical protein [bacterium]
MKRLFPLLLVFFVLFSASCDSESKLIYPPETLVNRVTDFYLFNDGRTFLYLSSNMNRKYDFGELVLMRFDDEGDPVFQESLLVPSISGKMTVSSDEKSVFITTRDKNGVVKAKISGKPGSYKIQYEEGTKGDYPEILKTKKEPYALTLNADESKLLVTHVLNGELSVIDTQKWEVIKTAKLKYGVTEILYDANSDYFLASHKSSGNISLIEAKETLDDFVVAVKEIPIDLPTKGYDVRSMKHSGDGKLFYAAFQNTGSEDPYTNASEEDTAPQIVTLKLENNSLETVNTLALSGNLGEMAVFAYSTETSDDSDNSDDADDSDVLDDSEDADDSDTADGSTSGTKAGGRIGDLIFVSVPNDEKVIMIDSARNSIRDEISYKDDEKDCKPYQLYAKNLGNTSGYLFVSCFQNDRVYIYKIDLASEQIVEKIGVLE